MAAKSPRRPRPARPAAAAPEGTEEFDVQEVMQDLANQNAQLTLELAAAKAVIRKLRKDLVEKSKNAPAPE